MSAGRLPQELFDDILAIAVHDWEISNVLKLRAVNYEFEREVTKRFARGRLDKAPTELTANIPLSFRLRLVRELIHCPEHDRTRFSVWMHATADYLEDYAKKADPTGSGLLSRDEWLEEICQVMAPREADCQTGILVCVVPYNYHRVRLPGSAFHVAMLRRHTVLEISMINDGLGPTTRCPYLMVLKSTAEGSRENALEWACQARHFDTVQRMLLGSKTPVPGYILAGALRIVAYHGYLEILDFLLLPHLNFSFRYSTFLEPGIEEAMQDAANNQQWEALARMLKRWPSCYNKNIIEAATKFGKLDLVVGLLSLESEETSVVFVNTDDWY